MATIKVFSSEGVKELKCFDTLEEVEYLAPDEDLGAVEVSDEDFDKL